MNDPGAARRSLVPVLVVRVLIGISSGFLATTGSAADFVPLTETASGRKASPRDLVALTVQGWDAFILGKIEAAPKERERFWHRDRSSAEAYDHSVEVNRARLRKYVGVVDRRTAPASLELVETWDRPAIRGGAADFEARAVRWTTLENVHGEGIALVPRGKVKACVILLPDADQEPEQLAGLEPGAEGEEATLARRLAGAGALVVIPSLASRSSTYSGDETANVYTDQSHREWIYRQAAEVGRHIIGYEVQKVLSLVDWFRESRPFAGGTSRPPPVAVIGYGEGGLVALYSAALDSRISVAWVAGYFQPREKLWSEPLYRSVWRLLEEFGDAEIASLIAPRALLVEHCRTPSSSVSNARPNVGKLIPCAAPGRLATPSQAEVQSEWQRACSLAGPERSASFHLVGGERDELLSFGSESAVQTFGRLLNVPLPDKDVEPWVKRISVLPAELANRQRRLVRELERHVQELVRRSESIRNEVFWGKLKQRTPAEWDLATEPFRRKFADEVIGRYADPKSPLRSEVRKLEEYADPRWTAYVVTLDVFPGVFTWGYLVVPNDLRAGERRPVVVCQHGAGGTPASVLVKHGRDFEIYRAFAATAAEKGFVSFAPYNPNKVSDEAFRQLGRKGNLLGKSLNSVILANHERLVEWLQQLPFVRADRIGYYGMSQGGWAGMRVSAVIKEYCLSICSGNFTDFVRKMTSVDYAHRSYLYYPSYEHIEFGLANGFNYAEMAALIAPRPFMVEHGYDDFAPGPLEWVGGEYAKVRRLYFQLGLPECTAIDFFGGGHTVHGQATFDFLARQLFDQVKPVAP